MPVHVIKPRNCGKTYATTCRCQSCGTHTTRLSDAFVNGLGWRRLCATCIDPERGPPRAYTGSWPITRHRPARPHLHIVGGDAGR